MEVASLSELKKELKEKEHGHLVDLCVRLAKYKKDNKELLNYLLFEAIDEDNYIDILKHDMETEFAGMNVSSVYLAKKSIRRILRMTTKHIRYSGIKQTEVELLIFFCREMRKLKLPFRESKVLINLYNRQLQNIQKALNILDEDLQFDYQEELEEIHKPLF